MALIEPKTEADIYLSPLGIKLFECDICGQMFSASMTAAWPFCTASIPHGKWDSKEQLKYKESLILTGDYPNINDFIRPALELKSNRKSVSWMEEALPSMPNFPQVRMTREKYAEFRDMYFIQGYFIGNVLNKYNWNMLLLIDYSIKTWGSATTVRTEEQPHSSSEKPMT